MSGNTEVDHPLCEECTDNLLNKLDSQLSITEKELESYKELLAALETNELEDDETLGKNFSGSRWFHCLNNCIGASETITFHCQFKL